MTRFGRHSRIANGQSFGTGSDSVTIGTNDDPRRSRGARRLGQGAMNTAYVLFAIAGFTLAVTLFSVVSSPVYLPPLTPK